MPVVEVQVQQRGRLPANADPYAASCEDLCRKERRSKRVAGECRSYGGGTRWMRTVLTAPKYASLAGVAFIINERRYERVQHTARGQMSVVIRRLCADGASSTEIGVAAGPSFRRHSPTTGSPRDGFGFKERATQRPSVLHGFYLPSNQSAARPLRQGSRK